MDAEALFVGATLTERDLARSEEFLEEVTDIPSQAAIHPLPIAQAGVCDQPVYFTIPSFADRDTALTVSGHVTASAALPASRRGVHMSRIVSSIDSMVDVHHSSLAAALRDVVAEVASTQDLTDADVTFAGTTIVRRATRVTGRTSPDCFGVSGRASLHDGVTRIWVGLNASVMTACPCTQAFSWHSTVIALTEVVGVDVANEVGRQLVGYTHSQRGSLEVEIESDDPAGLNWVFDAMAQGAHLTQDLLKRPDEHELVLRAHTRPQFTEDVVRSVATRLLSVLPQPPTMADIRVSCRNVESIHAHDVHSVVCGPAHELAEVLAASHP